MDTADTQRATTPRHRDQVRFAGRSADYVTAPPFTVGQLTSMRRLVHSARTAR